MENNYGVGLYQDGVFFFTNPGLYKIKDEEGNESLDFKALWNNREYTFKGKTTVPLIIANEPPENIQHIRKLFAKKYALGWWYGTKEYKDMVKKGGLTPAVPNEDKILKDVIQACLTPLPKSHAVIKDLPKADEDQFKASKALKTGQDPNLAFKDYEIPELGVM